MSEITNNLKKLANPNAIKEAIRVGVGSPLALYQRVIYGGQKAIQTQTRQLMENLGRKKVIDLEEYWEAITSRRSLHTHIAKVIGEANFGQLMAPEFLYVIVRMLKPEVVVETGVAAGISSAFILRALEDNGTGKLYSIDLPRHQAVPGALPLPEGKEPGFVIPESLKRRWELRLGKSKDLLPSLLVEIGKVDVFLHDSEHTYDNMMLEYTTAWDYLPKGALLLSHDIRDNDAFRDFSRRAKRKSLEIYFTGIGAIIK